MHPRRAAATGFLIVLVSGCSEPKKRRPHDDDEREAAYPKASASAVLAEVARVEASGEAPTAVAPAPSMVEPLPPRPTPVPMTSSPLFGIPTPPAPPPLPKRYAIRGPGAVPVPAGTAGIGGILTGPATAPEVEWSRPESTALKVKLVGLRTTDGVDSALDARTVRSKLKSFERCYEKVRIAISNFTGTVHVEVPVDESGAVGAIEPKATPSNGFLTRCIATSLAASKFPAVSKTAHRIIFDLELTEDSSAVLGGVTGGVTGGVAGGVASAAPAPTIQGTVLEKVTALEIEKALRAEGCTSVSSEMRTGSTEVVVFKLTTKEGVEMTLTFVPAKAAPGALPDDEMRRLERDAATKKVDGFFIAIESSDKSAARALLRAIVKE